MQPEQVTGLVLHFRTAQLTLACLDSLAGAGIRQVVLVDNSADGGTSLARLQALRQQATPPCASAAIRLQVVSPGDNLGFAGGVAAGLQTVRDLAGTTCPPVLLINSDAVLRAGALPLLCAALQQHAVAVPAIEDGQGRVAATDYHYQLTFALLCTRPPPGRHVTYPGGCCLLIHPDHVRADLFDRDFFFYGDDVMLGADLARRGASLAHCPAARVVHPGSLSARNGSLFYEYHMARAHWLLGRKLARNPLERALHLAGRLLVLPLRATLRMLRARSLRPWQGLLLATADGWRGRWRSLTPPPDAG